jgi:hypothetical protein
MFCSSLQATLIQPRASLSGAVPLTSTNLARTHQPPPGEGGPVVSLVSRSRR